MKKELIVNCNQIANLDKETETITLEQLSVWARSGKIFKKLYAYKAVRLHCDSLETLGQPFLIAAACRLLTVGHCVFEDDEQKTIRIGIFKLIQLFFNYLFEQITAPGYIKKVDKEINKLFEESTGIDKKEGSALFLRCDLPYYYMAGGSIGHIAGVVNNMEACTGFKPIFVSSRDIPTVEDDIRRYTINRNVQYKNAGDIMSIAYNENIEKALDEVFDKERISFIYQRSALNAYAGIEYAMKKKIPFVLEYNGSEIWIAKNWGNRDIKGLNISEKIERLTFEKADLITCVSRPLKQQLVEMGIDEQKIIVTPNGVNTEMYRPDIQGNGIRKKYGIGENKVVIGFIGTFGAWHGAEILAKAFAKLNEECQNVHLLMIGDGMKMAEVREVISQNHLENVSTLTGIVPQKEGPKYLAACDILVSPTIKNPDGTPFFGSPTKLFEYMAMGKGIVASDLDQMSEILENERTALLVEPNNVEDVAKAIMRLANDYDLRQKLGRNARDEVCSKYTWRMHTKRIVEALQIILTNKEIEKQKI